MGKHHEQCQPPDLTGFAGIYLSDTCVGVCGLTAPVKREGVGGGLGWDGQGCFYEAGGVQPPLPHPPRSGADFLEAPKAANKIFGLN